MQAGYILLPSPPVKIGHILKILVNFVLMYLDYICSMGLCDVHAIHHSVLCREVKSGNWVRISAATPTVALWREPAWPTLAFVAIDGARVSPANISKYWSNFQIDYIYPLFKVFVEGHATFSSQCLFQLTNAIGLNSTQGGNILLPSIPVKAYWHIMHVM